MGTNQTNGKITAVMEDFKQHHLICISFVIVAKRQKRETR